MSKVRINFRHGPLDGMAAEIDGPIPELMVFGDVHDPADPEPMCGYSVMNRALNVKYEVLDFFYTGNCKCEDLPDWLWPKHDSTNLIEE